MFKTTAMEDSRVHPTNFQSPPTNSSADDRPLNHKPLPPPPPPPETFIVQFPKDQILRYPPPENARKYQHLISRRKTQRRRRCCLVCLCIVLAVAALAAVTAGLMFLIFRFKSPSYQIQDLSIDGLDLTSASPVSPSFGVTVRADNRNKKVGIYYEKGGYVGVFYDGVKLGDGVTPVFYQGRKNVTVFETALTGSDVVLGGDVKKALTDAVGRKDVPFVVRLKAPVRVELGSVKTWEITVKLKCDVAVDSLGNKPLIVSNHCDYNVRLW